jgi:hypothetical protein
MTYDREEDERQLNFSAARRTDPAKVYRELRKIYGSRPFMREAMLKVAVRRWSRNPIKAILQWFRLRRVNRLMRDSGYTERIGEIVEQKIKDNIIYGQAELTAEDVDYIKGIRMTKPPRFRGSAGEISG